MALWIGLVVVQQQGLVVVQQICGRPPGGVGRWGSAGALGVEGRGESNWMEQQTGRLGLHWWR